MTKNKKTFARQNEKVRAANGNLRLSWKVSKEAPLILAF